MVDFWSIDRNIYIHTIELSQQLNRSKYKELKDEYFNKAKGKARFIEYKRDSEKEITIYKMFKNIGVIVTLTRRFDKDWIYIKIKINLNNFIGKQSKIIPFQVNTRNLLALEINLIRVLSELHISYQDVCLRRADYCWNIYHPNVGNIVSLVQKCAVPYGYHKYRKQQHLPEGSLHLKGRLLNLLIYDKENQMLNSENGHLYSKHEIKQAKNLLRIEIQLKRESIYKMEKKLALPRLFDDFVMYMSKLSEEAVESILRFTGRNLGRASYFSRENAISQIENSHYKFKTRELMIRYIDVLDESIDVDEAIEKIRINNPFAKESDWYKEKFKKVNINMVTGFNCDSIYELLKTSIYKEVS